MACYHPLAAFVKSIKSNGKKDLYFLKSFNWDAFEHYPNPFSIAVDGVTYMAYKTQIIKLPCGQCIGCRLSRSREWAVRCMLEMESHQSAYFITLTYDDVHLPRAPDPIVVGDEEIFFSTVQVRDFQLFMKRLRKKCEPKRIRFFGCGEYGEQSLRAHYHIIVFGLELNDLVPQELNKAKVSGAYSRLYSSQFVEDCWTDDKNILKGRVRIGKVTFESCAYVARYTTKKKDKAFLDAIGAEKEFILMSRRPGIAREYFDLHSGEVYDFDKIYLSKGGESFDSKPPRYFDKLFDVDHHDELQAIVERRKIKAEGLEKVKLAQTSLTPLQYLETCESVQLSRFNKLRRSLE